MSPFMYKELHSKLAISQKCILSDKRTVRDYSKQSKVYIKRKDSYFDKVTYKFVGNT